MSLGVKLVVDRLVKYGMSKLIVLLVVMSSCSTMIVNGKYNTEHLKDLLGKRITVSGKAINAKLGALIMNEGSPLVWMDDLPTWPDGYYFGDSEGKLVEVTGVLIEKYDLPVFIHKKGETWRSGIPVPEGTDLKKASQRFLLTNFKWKVMGE